MEIGFKKGFKLISEMLYNGWSRDGSCDIIYVILLGHLRIWRLETSFWAG